MTEDLRIGRIFNADKAPEYVLFNGKLTIDDLNKLSQYADSNGEIKFDILRSKAGHPYMKINDWRPNNAQTQSEPTQSPAADIPMPELGDTSEDMPF